MRKKTANLRKALGLFIFLTLQISHSQSLIWEKASNSSKVASGKSNIHASVYSLNVDQFEQRLHRVSVDNPEKLDFPTEGGTFLEFIF